MSTLPRRCAVILAAGQGKRMNSDLAKVLHPFAGRPMIDWVLDAARTAGCQQLNVVIGHAREQVQQHLGAAVTYAVQDRQLGTGHAAQCGIAPLPADWSDDSVVLVLCGDTPLLNGRRLNELCDSLLKEKAAAVVMTFKVSGQHAYGRIVRDPKTGGLVKIVEDRDCTPEQTAINEVNSGVYAFKLGDLKTALRSLKNDNSQGEYYLTDSIGALARAGKKVVAVVNPDESEVAGVNSPQELQKLEAVYHSRPKAQENRA
ncbi:MAG TPA: NTP transferase domain-containing protein [Planctomycetota bacterium]|nr:NTP transferase domain-containing protein [Planctomycetota bacterium]